MWNKTFLEILNYNVTINTFFTQTKFIKMKCPEVVQMLWADFKVAYSDVNVLKWSAWWSLSLCGYILVNFLCHNL